MIVGLNVVCVENMLRQKLGLDSDLFWTIDWRIEIKILNVKSENVLVV